MSDGTWDAEYNRASDLKDEIREFCESHSIPCPQFREYARTWELIPMLKELKERYK
jgi:hypothetical protein